MGAGNDSLDLQLHELCHREHGALKVLPDAYHHSIHVLNLLSAQGL